MVARVSFRIHYDRRSGLAAWLTLGLLVALFLGYLAWGQREAAASGPQASAAGSTGMRRYYQTRWASYDGDTADTACASGYHMASLWEILDPSNLKYDTSLGYQNYDSGQGPPAGSAGWVRTGGDSSNSSTAGVGNCNNWSSNSNGDYGTYASLPTDWTVAQDIYVWQVNTQTCDTKTLVWCVEDIVYKVYLPLVVRNR